MKIEDIINNFISQLKPVKISLGYLRQKSFKNIFFIGLGGSGLAAKMLLELKEEIGVKNEVNLLFYEGYFFKKSLPKNNSLAIIISYSGETREALKLAKDFKKRGASLIFVSTDGRLKKLANLWKVDFIEIPKTFSPRYSIGSQFFILLSILKELSLLEKNIPNFSKIKTREIIQESKEISNKFKKGEIILIYSLAINKFLAYDLKIRLNEDAKILAFNNHLPEAVHNEFLSFPDNKKNIRILFISGIKRCLFEKHIKIIFESLKENKINFEEITLGSKNIKNYFKQIIFNISFSYFIAKRYKKDILGNSFLKNIKSKF